MGQKMGAKNDMSQKMAVKNNMSQKMGAKNGAYTKILTILSGFRIMTFVKKILTIVKKNPDKRIITEILTKKILDPEIWHPLFSSIKNSNPKISRDIRNVFFIELRKIGADRFLVHFRPDFLGSNKICFQTCVFLISFRFVRLKYSRVSPC